MYKEGIDKQESRRIESLLQFAIFCIEGYADFLHITGTQSYDLLTSGDNILHNYIIPNYDVLHTQGKEYIINDIISLLKGEE